MMEKDACKMWCPMVRFSRHGGGPANRDMVATEDVVYEWNSCIARRCAMWRWNDAKPPQSSEDEAGLQSGYCGLAGKPKDEE